MPAAFEEVRKMEEKRKEAGGRMDAKERNLQKTAIPVALQTRLLAIAEKGDGASVRRFVADAIKKSKTLKQLLVFLHPDKRAKGKINETLAKELAQEITPML